MLQRSSVSLALMRASSFASETESDQRRAGCFGELSAFHPMFVLVEPDPVCDVGFGSAVELRARLSLRFRGSGGPIIIEALHIVFVFALMFTLII